MFQPERLVWAFGIVQKYAREFRDGEKHGIAPEDEVRRHRQQ